MSNTDDNEVQANDASDPPNWFAPEDPGPHPSWGPFLPMRAQKAIRKLASGNAQHVGLYLSGITPRDGKTFVVQKVLAADTGRHHSTIKAAIKELFALGILSKAKRTMGGFDIVWGKVAYGLTDAAAVGQRAEKMCSSPVKEIRDALRLDLRPAYCARVVARYPEDLAAGSPDVRKLALLTNTGESLILDNLVFLAISQNVIPTGQIVDKTLERWMKRNGDGNFLVKNRHPLQRFSEDVGRIVCRMLAEIQKSSAGTNSATSSNETLVERSTKYSTREIEEHRKIMQQRIAALPKHLRPKFYTDAA